MTTSEPTGEWREGDIATAITYPNLLRLYDYWRARCESDRLPARRNVDPVEMAFILANLILVDVERGPDGVLDGFRYRLIGTNLVDRLHIEMTGRRLDTHPDPNFRALAQRVYRRVAEGMPIVVRQSAVIDNRPRFYEVVLLPLAADGRTVDMVLARVWFAPSPLESGGIRH
jgi:hypothetical protein